MKNPQDPQDPVIAKKSWVSFFADNRKLGNGFSLNYVPPNVEDSVFFFEDEWNEGSSIWKSSLIGQVLGLNAKFKAMETYVLKVWGNLAIPKVCLLKPGLFLFKFKSTVDMRSILENDPWFFGSRPILLKHWSVDDEIEKRNDCVYPVWIHLPGNDCVYPVWIHLPGLKLNLWNAKSISKIASIIDKPIATDKLTANRQRLAYARVLVEVNMPSKLPDEILIQGQNGKNYLQKVFYELKPRWCNFCRVVGHESNLCRRQGDLQARGNETMMQEHVMEPVHVKNHEGVLTKGKEAMMNEDILHQNVPLQGKEIDLHMRSNIEYQEKHGTCDTFSMAKGKEVLQEGQNYKDKENISPMNMNNSWTLIQGNKVRKATSSFSGMNIDRRDPSTIDRGVFIK
ncbi:uncharacterized protein LOC109838251 [Asparagus officinalis]|uniref:uncharacterized protein LOC109838251 n=1 Tax=Asparagus officinalis TaxID=4686 RepID=UPI00098E8526|nr:uncharacterized protein LOC109838251 [Asparagus officinalis]